MMITRDEIRSIPERYKQIQHDKEQLERMHETPISSDGSYYTYVVCTAKECKYEPKDEPQMEDWQDWKDKMWAEAIVTEPQTERSE